MTMRNWPLLRWAVAALGVAGSALVVGVPTGIIGTPWYTRMTPVVWWNYPVWVVTAVVSGLILATYVRTDTHSARPSRMGIGGNMLSLLAVGCPACNKIVVLAVGTSGATTLWAPLQPVLGAASVGLLGWALWRRLRGERACAVNPAKRSSKQPAGR